MSVLEPLCSCAYLAPDRWDVAFWKRLARWGEMVEVIDS